MSNHTNIPEPSSIDPNNWYHQHRKEIYEWWEKMKEVDDDFKGYHVSDVCSAYRKHVGMGDPDGTPDGVDAAITEFSRYVESIPGNETKAYFIG